MYKQNTWDALWWLEKKQLRNTIKYCISWIVIYGCYFFYAITRSDTYMMFSMGTVVLSMIFASKSYSKFAHVNAKFVLTSIDDIHILVFIKYVLALIPTIVAISVMFIEMLFLNGRGVICIDIAMDRWIICIIWIFILPMYFILLQFYYKFAWRITISILSIIVLNALGITNMINRHIYVLINILYIIFLCFHIFIMKTKITKEYIWRGVRK